MVVKTLLVAFCLALASCGRPLNQKPDFIIAAAADLRFAMDEIIEQFQREQPSVTVKATYGSSGQFYSQIENGAPFDVYCSADIAYPRKLVESGFALRGSEFRYAVGRIVAWVRADSPIPVESLQQDSLRHPSVLHIAIAHPDHAPYGKAAVSAMHALGVYEDVKSKLAYGENVSQALMYVQQGSAQIGIVALSLALAPTVQKSGRYWEFPLDSYPRMEQGGVILKSSRNPKVAQAFRSFMVSENAGAVLKRYGFSLPGT